ncbi:MAG: ribokinase [Proteobacteria bacterium]|jgi:ribokinase|nr:ribokinase [Methylibium sp.]MBY0366387.1 ribokinase [Burkholderiaceae bacterium]MCH8856767.1 ribokinase [Pseudomonadota bacterium]RTL23586.1 MAG: ribokinase [Burkholderiales bacterium]|mmetsp:Transcript_1008/g.2453  ORF Transcript_1008/g.2453 Transcript_1008/m.2453 type:complete len:310 (-) Transcript_1008:3106-4035(-)
MTRPEILVLGSVNRDLIVHAPRLPLPGETLRGQRFSACLGGKGANQAVAAARLGARVALAARVGQLENGAAMVAQLAGEGVDTRAIVQPADELPGVALIVVGAEDAENQIVTVAGSNGSLPLEQVDALDLDGLRWLVAQQELPLESIARAFERARAAGAKTLLNAAPFRAGGARLMPLVDLLVVNALEARALVWEASGQPREEAAPEALARSLREQGPASVLISLGADGLYWLDDQGGRRVTARPVKAVDTVGAGDTLVGALVTALAEGQDLDRALGFAQTAASLSVSRPGVQEAMPYRAEVDAALASA